MKPSSFPARRAYAWISVALMGFAVYVSLLPFDLQPVAFDSALAEFRTVMLAPPYRRTSRVNFLANILMFVPVGFGLTGALLANTRRRAAVIPAIPLVLATSVAVSLLAEFLQIFAPGRVPSRHDVAAQTIGCLIGIGAWTVMGPELTAWLRAAAERRAGRLARGLAGYAAVWTFVNLAPFDITLNPGDIARRIRSGLITLVPFGADVPPYRLVWDILSTTISAAPLGVLGLLFGAGRHDARAAFAFGALLVFAVEAAQIFIRSHAADTGDIMFGWLGVALGVWVGLRTLHGRAATIPGATGRAVRRWAVPALVAWFVLICAYHWMPYDFSMDNAAISRKLARMSLLPFAGYRRGSDLNALTDMLVKLGLSIPFGLIAAFVFGGTPARAVVVASLALAVAVFAVVEAGQLFLPSRTPDPTDILTGVIGTGLGLWLAHWLQAGHDPSARIDAVGGSMTRR